MRWEEGKGRQISCGDFEMTSGHVMSMSSMKCIAHMYTTSIVFLIQLQDYLFRPLVAVRRLEPTSPSLGSSC